MSNEPRQQRWVPRVLLDQWLHSFDDQPGRVGEAPRKAVNRWREFESNFPLSIVLVVK